MDTLHDFDFSSFWEDSDYVRKTYVAKPLEDDMIAKVEAALGVALPSAYVTLAKSQNGGAPVNPMHAAPPTSWADDHVALSAIFSISFEKYGLCGEMGSAFWSEEWGYPDDLIYFADCPSAGHDMFALNYRVCGPQGEPSVVHVDQEDDYTITEVAPNFAAFIRGLQPEDAFD